MGLAFLSNLLIRVFRSFTFKVVTNVVEFKSIILLFMFVPSVLCFLLLSQDYFFMILFFFISSLAYYQNSLVILVVALGPISKHL